MVFIGVCCCCCQVASVVSHSVRPQRRQPTRLPRPWDSPVKNTGVGCHFLLQCMKVKSESEVAQSCLTLSDPMDCSPPGSFVHRIFQARVLEWGATAFSVIGVSYVYFSQYLLKTHLCWVSILTCLVLQLRCLESQKVSQILFILFSLHKTSALGYFGLTQNVAILYWASCLLFA